jgi:hypothetical protein
VIDVRPLGGTDGIAPVRPSVRSCVPRDRRHRRRRRRRDAAAAGPAVTQLLEEALERSLREMIAEQRKAASLSCT